MAERVGVGEKEVREINGRVMSKSTNVSVKNETITVQHFNWNCPGCDHAMYSQYDPQPNNLLCGSCERKEASREFGIRFAPVVGAVVESIVEPVDIFDNDDDDVRTLYLRDSSGGRWFVGSDTGLFVYRVDEDGRVVYEERHEQETTYQGH